MQSNMNAVLCALLLVGTINLSSTELECDEENVELTQISANETALSRRTVIFMCTTELPAPYPLWEINSEVYAVTDLPQGFRARGSNLTFAVYNTTNIRCSFLTYRNGMFVNVCSKIGTVVPEGPSLSPQTEGCDKMCDPENFVFSIIMNKVYISWHINNYDPTVQCDFLIYISNGTHGGDPPCSIYAMDMVENVMWSLNECLELTQSNGVIIEVESIGCEDNQNCCRSPLLYRPGPMTSRDIMVNAKSDGKIHDLSNPYCYIGDHLTDLMLCFDSNVEALDGCSVDQSNFQVMMSNSGEWSLGVKNVPPDLDGTVISIFCLCSDRCPEDDCTYQTEIFNLKISYFNDAQDINILEMIEPAIQQTPCPGQWVLYECCILTPSTTLIWTLPDSSELELNELGDVRKSSDDNYRANLTGKMEINENTNSFLLTSTLLILETTNSSTLNCSGGTETNLVIEGVPLTLSGSPDSPQNLSYNITEDTVALQWSRPTYTGGERVTVMEYRVTANDQTETVISSDEMVTHTSSGLIYGDVQVTAINSCGQESDPATVTITASAPTNVSKLSVELYCDVPLKDGRPVALNWIYELQKNGIVYPEVESVSAKLEPGNLNCPVSNNSCIVNITKDDNYTVNVTSNNAIDSTTYQDSFESMPLNQTVVNESSEGRLTVTLTIQEICRNANYTIVVFFGVQNRGGDNCDLSPDINKTATNVLPGVSRTFIVNDTTFKLGDGQKYCYNGSLIGDAGIILDDVHVLCEPSSDGGGEGSGGDTSSSGLSNGEIGGVSACVVVVVIGGGVYWLSSSF